MLNRLWVVLVMVLAISVAGAHAAEPWKQGTHYTMLKAPQPVASAGKIEVIEFFWYGCPHCNSIEPFVETWAAKLPRDVTFRREHVVWPGRPDIEAHARIFLVLKSMGLDAKYQQAVFDATFKEKLDMRRKEVAVEWAGKHGLDKAKFASLYDSFAINGQLEQSRQLAKIYNVQDVPNIIVNGRWVTSPGHIGKEDGTVLQVVDELIVRERGPAALEKRK
jgi:thiol:disulfide interchange protein DsbA